jgi:hypothetical protein
MNRAKILAEIEFLEGMLARGLLAATYEGKGQTFASAPDLEARIRYFKRAAGLIGRRGKAIRVIPRVSR